MDYILPSLTENETVEEDSPNLRKLTETCIMLKKRISESHEVIKQYNDKVKECERLKQDLSASKSQLHKITHTHNSTLAKVIKLELQHKEYEKNIETLKTQVQNYTVKGAADEQHVQQLICKIKDIEGKQNDKMLQYDLEKSSLQVKVKELESELKNAKKLHDTKIKKIEKKHVVENESKPRLKDVEVNTELIEDTVIKKPKMVDASVLTDKFYGVKNEFYPLFCDKCEVLIDPPPIDKICTMMINSCPDIIERIPSPPRRPLEIATGSNNDENRVENEQPSTIPSRNTQNPNSVHSVPSNLLCTQRTQLNGADCCNVSPTSTLKSHSPLYVGSTPTNVSTANLNNSNHCDSMSTIASSLAIIPWFQGKVDTLEAKISVLQKKLKKSQQNTFNHHLNSREHYPDNSKLLEMKKMIDLYKNKGIENFDMDDRRSRSRVKKKRLQNMRSDSWTIEPIVRRTDPNSNSIERFKKTKQRNKAIVIEDLGRLDSTSDVDTSTDPSNYDTLESEDVHHVKPSSSSNVENVNIVECSKSVGGETDSGILSDSMQHESDMDLTELRNATETATPSRRSYCTKNIESKLIKKPFIKGASNLIESDKSIEKNTLEMSIKENEHIEHMECDNRMEVIENDNLVCTRITRKRKMCDLKKSGDRKKLLDKVRSLRKTSKVETFPKTFQPRNVNESSRTGEEEKELLVESNSHEDDYTPKKKPRIAHVPKNTTEQKSSQSKKRVVKSVENDVPSTSDNHDFNQTDDTENHDSGILDDTENRDLNRLNNTVNHTEVLSTLDNMENHDLNVLDNTRAENHTRDLSLPDVVENCTDQNPVNCNTKHVIKYTVPIVSETASSINDENESIINDVRDLGENELTEIATKQNSDIKHEHEINSLGISKVQETAQRSNDEQSPHTSKISDVKKISKKSETINNIIVEKEDSNTNQTKIIKTLLMRLQQHVTENNSNKSKNKRKGLQRICLVDEFVKKQLQRLASSNWEISVHWDVVEKLKSTTSSRIIAKGIVEFLSMETEHPEPLDKSYTPPAPLMSKTHQKIVTLLIDLGEQKSDVFQLVQTAIEYKLFRLNQSLSRTVIESLSRIYTILARIKKDRERVRMFCCDALYCLGLNVVSVLYVVLTCWPEVFPNNQTNSEPLPKCMAHLIMSTEATNFPKLLSLKNLLSVYYKYPMESLSPAILNELLMLLQKKCDVEVETAIILLAKREGTAWTYQNIIKGALLPMIINQKLPSTYRAFCLLGNLMRVFPVEDKDNLVGEIVAQLCDLINSGEGSDEQKEGVFLALLCLSRHKFDTVIANTVRWVPSVPLQDRTVEQINGLLNLRTVEFWRGYLRKNKLLPNIQKKRKT